MQPGTTCLTADLMSTYEVNEQSWLALANENLISVTQPNGDWLQLKYANGTIDVTTNMLMSSAAAMFFTELRGVFDKAIEDAARKLLTP